MAPLRSQPLVHYIPQVVNIPPQYHFSTQNCVEILQLPVKVTFYILRGLTHDSSANHLPRHAAEATRL